jgi:hypothetical protein
MTHTTEMHLIIPSAAERVTPPIESTISLIDNGPLTGRDVLRAGMRRRARRKEMARESIWDSDDGVGKPRTTDVPLGGTPR